MKGKRNPIAKAVRTPAFKMQVVQDKTQYKRKDKFKKDLRVLLSFKIVQNIFTKPFTSS
jgi:hypothetical protein